MHVELVVKSVILNCLAISCFMGGMIMKYISNNQDDDLKQ